MQRLTLSVLVLAMALPAYAQTREKGPWWPSQWGADDQMGASNRITAETILKAAQLVKTGKMYELGQVYDRDMPLFPGRTYAMFIPGSPTGGPFGNNNMLMYHDDFLCAEIGQVGTQFDGLAHIGTRMTMADGSTQDIFYNGTPVSEMKGPYGMNKLGIEHVRSFVTRGVLIDIAGYKGLEHLEHSYEVSVADVRGALAKQGIAEDSIEEGDALLFNYGWSKLWSDPDTYNTNPPGIGMEAAAWIIDKKPSMIGSDQWATEVIPNPDPDLTFPVHSELIPKNGIFNLENMIFDEVLADGEYEFLFIFAPTRFKGGTGSPGRPIAIR